MRWRWLLIAVASLTIGVVLLVSTSTYACPAVEYGTASDCGTRTVWVTVREILIVTLSVGSFAYSFVLAFRTHRPPKPRNPASDTLVERTPRRR